jgi:hypothetical protein
MQVGEKEKDTESASHREGAREKGRERDDDDDFSECIFVQ